MNRILGVVLAVMLLGGCTLFQDSGQQEQRSDVASRIKTRLINEQSLDAAAIQVEQAGDTIVLRGFADDEAKKKRLEDLAREVAGNRQIDNQIKIR